MADNRKISTYKTQRRRILKEEKGVDLVSVLAKSVGCSDSEKQDVKKDEHRLMTVRKEIHGDMRRRREGRQLEMSHALMILLLHFR